MTFGLFDSRKGLARAYVHSVLAELGSRAVVNDTFDGAPIVIVFDKAAALVIAFEARDAAGAPLTFDVGTYAVVPARPGARAHGFRANGRRCARHVCYPRRIIKLGATAQKMESYHGPR